MKLAEVEPAATVMDAGTVSAGLSSATATAKPPEGATPDSVTVQADVAPDARLAGEHCKADTVGGGGVTVTDAVLEPALTDAATVTL